MRTMKLSLGPITAFKLIKANGEGPFNGGITYEVGKTYEVAEANTNEHEPCGAGINLATIDWCLNERQRNYRLLLCTFNPEDIAAIPYGTDGKFRVTKCKVVREVDWKEVEGEIT